MAFSKFDIFHLGEKELATVGRGISHPARIRILDCLLKNPGLTPSQLTELLPLSFPTVSQHLKILRNTHLVSYEEIYPNVYYSLNSQNSASIKELIRSICQIATKRNKRLRAVQ